MKNVKLQLQGIINNLNQFLCEFVSTKDTIEGAFLRLEKLENYLENNCMLPESMDFKQMKVDIMECYAPYEDSMANALTDLDDLREELSDLGPKDNKKYSIYEKLLQIEDCIDIKENKISSIDDYYDAVRGLINSLEEIMNKL